MILKNGKSPIATIHLMDIPISIVNDIWVNVQFTYSQIILKNQYLICTFKF